MFHPIGYTDRQPTGIKGDFNMTVVLQLTVTGKSTVSKSLGKSTSKVIEHYAEQYNMQPIDVIIALVERTPLHQVESKIKQHIYLKYHSS